AFQAAIPIVGNPLPGFGEAVGIVAGDAPEAAVALSIAAALVHLLDLSDRVEALAGGGARAKDAHELRELQAGALGEGRAAGQGGAIRTLEVALFADGLAQRGGLQRGRVDDAQVSPVDPLRPPDVERARPVTALTADRESLEPRTLPLHQLDAIGMAE